MSVREALQSKGVGIAAGAVIVVAAILIGYQFVPAGSADSGVDDGWICPACQATFSFANPWAGERPDELRCPKCEKDTVEWRGLYRCLRCNSNFEGYRAKFAPYPEGFSAALPNQDYMVKYPNGDWQPGEALLQKSRRIACPACGKNDRIVELGSKQWRAAKKRGEI